jgi:hypothetical protein
MGVRGGTSPLRIVRPKGAIKIIYIKFILSQSLVGAGDPLPHGFPSSCPCRRWRQHYIQKNVIKEKAYYNDSAQKTPAVRKNVRGMNAPITNNATIIPTGFSSGIVGFSWPDVLQNAVIRCIALLFQEKHFR